MIISMVYLEDAGIQDLYVIVYGSRSALFKKDQLRLVYKNPNIFNSLKHPVAAIVPEPTFHELSSGLGPIRYRITHQIPHLDHLRRLVSRSITRYGAIGVALCKRRVLANGTAYGTAYGILDPKKPKQTSCVRSIGPSIVNVLCNDFKAMPPFPRHLVGLNRIVPKRLGPNIEPLPLAVSSSCAVWTCSQKHWKHQYFLP